MNPIKSWRDYIGTSYKPRTTATFAAVPRNDQLLSSLCFSTRDTHHSVVAYVEVYLSHDRDIVHGLGALFIKQRDVVYVHDLLLGERIPAPVRLAGQVLHLELSEPSREVQLSCSINYSMDKAARRWRLLDVIAHLIHRPAWGPAQERRWIMDYSVEAGAHGKEDSDLLVTCPSCFGDGSYVSFAIPKEDRESGRSGYDLYSCNTINAAHACALCGGSGVEYRDWYLKEKPELLQGLAQLRRGSGQIRHEVTSSAQLLEQL